MKPTLRTFVAFKLPENIIDRVAELQNEFSACGLKLRWVKTQNLHLTLKFLGNISETDVSGICDVIKNMARHKLPLKMTLQGIGVFPRIKRARVLWLGIGGEVDRLKRLHSEFEAQLSLLGFNRDKKQFTAHLTIGRFKKVIAPERMLKIIEALGNFSPLSFTVHKLVFYKSDLYPKGAVYTPLVEAMLTEP